LRSLRYRIPAFFLVGVLVAAAITALFAVQLFRDDSHDRTLADLRRQAAGLALLYEEQAIRSVDEAKQAPGFAAPLLEEATGSRIYYAGLEIFPGQKSGLRSLDRDVLDWQMLEAGNVETAERPLALSSWPSRAPSFVPAGSLSPGGWAWPSSPGSRSQPVSFGTCPGG
jgi:hypothetical protein